MRILAGDVGGTKTLLSVFENEGDGFRELRSKRYDSADYPGLESMAREFLGDGGGDVDRAGFGVAGPVEERRCKTTNLPWELDADELERTLRIGRVRLVNDFQAVALGIPSLGAEHLEVLQDVPADPDGAVAILGAGTGLGEAIVVPTTDGPRILASEGGHTDFAPRDEVEMGLLRMLLERLERVSVERVVSGPGLHAIYELVITRKLAPESPDLGERLRTAEDPSRVIGESALAGTDRACSRAVDLFLSLYGAEAGNLALKVLPSGGLYVAGGIAPRLLPLLKKGVFLDSFLRKGRMRHLLERIRVSVITEPRVGLLGARNAVL